MRGIRTISVDSQADQDCLKCIFIGFPNQLSNTATTTTTTSQHKFQYNTGETIQLCHLCIATYSLKSSKEKKRKSSGMSINSQRAKTYKLSKATNYLRGTEVQPGMMIMM